MTTIPVRGLDPYPERPLHQRELHTLMGAAAYQARRVARTLKLSQPDREDAEQEILLALLERRRFFDPARGSWSPFAHRIARQAAQAVADGVVTARKLEAAPLDEPAVEMIVRRDEPVTLGETIEDRTALAEPGLLHTMSMISFLAGLTPELRVVAEAAMLADGDLADAQRTLSISTTEFYRRLREIRYRLFTLSVVDRRRVQGP